MKSLEVFHHGLLAIFKSLLEENSDFGKVGGIAPMDSNFDGSTDCILPFISASLIEKRQYFFYKKDNDRKRM